MREKLIKIIARCNSKQVKHDWIREMAYNSDIECSESQCIGCLIAEDCIEALEYKEVVYNE